MLMHEGSQTQVATRFIVDVVRDGRELESDGDGETRMFGGMVMTGEVEGRRPMVMQTMEAVENAIKIIFYTLFELRNIPEH